MSLLRRFTLSVTLSLLLLGCTSIVTTQTETTVGTNQVKTTRVAIRSFFDSAAKVNKLRATGTEKTQGLSIGEASTESSGTNAVEIIIRGAAISKGF